MKKTLLLIAVMTTSLLSAQNVPSYVPTDSLVGWYPFNGNANDESGNNNNGIVYGASLTSDRNGNTHSAYTFQITSSGWGSAKDRIVISNDDIALSWQQTNAFTISAWIRLNTKTGSFANRPHTILGIWDGNGSALIRHQVSSTNLQRVQLSSNAYAVGNATILNNDWVHVVTTWDGDTIRHYQNGAATGKTYLSYNIPSSTNYGDITLGEVHMSNGHWYHFVGDMDDLGIWNRALSPSEIIGLFNDCQDSLVSQPSSNTFQTVPGSANFTTAHSDTSATYQWQQNTGTGWTNLSDFGIYSGTTTDSLVLTGITKSLNGSVYRCVIDACTMDTTDIAYLTVVDNVGIDEDEATITIAPNPTSGIVTIGLNSTTEYKVYNVNGQVVAKGNTDGQIDLTNLPSGNYQLIVDSEDGSTVHSIQKI